MKAFAHQARELATNWLTPARALLWQMRTGKTKTIIDNAELLYNVGDIDAVIVVAPNGVHRNWTAKQLPLHATVPYCGYAWRSVEPERMFMVHNILRYDGMKWLTLNMEALIREDAQAAIRVFIRSCPNFMLVVDESHHYGQPGSQRSGKIKGLAYHARYRRILTGTVIENAPLQAYSQFEILQPAALGFDNYAGFEDYFGVEGIGYRGSKAYRRIVDYKNLPTLRERMAPFSSVVLREDCADLPPVQIDSAIVELTDEQRECYEALQRENIPTLLDLGFQAPPTGGALLTKLQQIEAGYLKTPLGIISFKSDKFNVILGEIYDCKSLIWAVYTEQILTLTAALGKAGYRARSLYGETTPKERLEILAAFQHGDLDAIVAQPRAAGEGYEISADKLVWASATPDAIVRAQANERATVAGGTAKQIVDVYSLGGVDEYFLKLTTNKTALADDIARRGLQNIIKELSI